MKIILLTIHIVFFTLFFSCNKENNDELSFDENIPSNNNSNTNITDSSKTLLKLKVPENWTLLDKFYGSKQNGYAAFRTKRSLNGVPSNIVAFVVNLEDSTLYFDVMYNKIGSNINTITPTNLYNQYQSNDTLLMLANGGYFSGNLSLSLLIDQEQLISPNVKSISRTLGTYYPTRSAFGYFPTKKSSLKFEIGWVYDISNTTYIYPTPALNDVTKIPLAQPNVRSPTDGSTWNPVEAIGGSPILIKNGMKMVAENVISEIIDANSGINPSGLRPRTAIAYTKEGYLIVMVAEGDLTSTTRVAGISHYQLADLLLEWGAYNALNLDGGGSTAMLIKGKSMITANKGTERPVVSFISIKKKK